MLSSDFTGTDKQTVIPTAPSSAWLCGSIGSSAEYLQSSIASDRRENCRTGLFVVISETYAPPLSVVHVRERKITARRQKKGTPEQACHGDVNRRGRENRSTRWRLTSASGP